MVPPEICTTSDIKKCHSASPGFVGFHLDAFRVPTRYQFALWLQSGTRLKTSASVFSQRNAPGVSSFYGIHARLNGMFTGINLSIKSMALAAQM